MCSCTTAKCAGCACGCRHTPATRRAFWQGVHAARDAVAAMQSMTGLLGKDDALAAIDALRGSGNPGSPTPAERGEQA